ncbi:hypothetical protein ACIRF8_33790 [Streptomyces sp. NPDC102406]|uniref:hypothetical protein n=1 Tax=Streptomyces sp. NPDC102406 TaxID=3366171 RepID=UPI0037F7B250
MPRTRPRVMAVHAIALALTTALTLTGCEAAHRTLDCVRTANAIANSFDDLQRAARDAALDPSDADRYFSPIRDDLKDIARQSDDVDVDKAVKDLGRAVTNVSDALGDGDKSPDLGPAEAAAGELTKACAR